MIYEPREDSYLLQKYVKRFVKPNSKVLDMGTGSGIQAITASKISKNITAADINKECILKLKTHPEIKAIQSNLFQNIKGKFDIIIFNPPYLPEDPNEPEDSKLTTTGGKKGSEIIEQFLKQAKNHLNPDGKILLVYSSLTKNIKEIIKLNYSEEVLSQENYFMEKLFVSKLSKSL